MMVPATGKLMVRVCQWENLGLAGLALFSFFAVKDYGARVKDSIKIMLALGFGFAAMAAYDFFVATYASKSGGFFSGLLWKLREIFGPGASASALLGIALIFFFVAFYEASTRRAD
ncbi:hypothetical protein G3580_07950 [Nitrogeniibacter mangrovi]|uniref:Uncharacterized protein n=1 Tax=Nitrogeniibacter mangrovi TaxID=2016596 RepID=A0A6C1B2H4_9RHOO|nr:hypothetical protein [Nitrogeniibacter mangrovi]QID17583.1 hypothetical protein G3580_07950 [Nitrogeniibacter mangrovi]